jgi:hypothetical protein
MAAFNVVRFRVKPGFEQQFVDHHRNARPGFKGALSASLIRTGDRTFCIIGEWRNMNSLAAARPEMIGILDGMRHMLEDLGGGLGVTDPVSGEVVARVGVANSVANKKRPARKAKRAKAKRKR